MGSKSQFYFNVLTGLSVVAFAPAAQAQMGGLVPLEEIVVVAQKRVQNIQDVPAAVSALSTSALEKSNVVTVNQLNALIPNFQVSQPFGAGGPGAFTIRGISSTDFSHNQSRPVALYVDEGVRQLPPLEFMPMFDVERVEVLRGPQGVLYGKNATGGAINIITKRPGLDVEGYVMAGYGKYDRRESKGAIQAPIIDDKLAARIAYTYLKDDGVIDNVHPGVKDLDQTDIFGVRASVLYKASGDFEALLRLNHYTSTGATAATKAIDIDFAGAGFPSLAAVPGSDRESLGFFENDQEIRGSQDLEVSGANLQLNWDISDAVNLVSITTYDEAKWTRLMDGDGLPTTLTPFDENARDLSQFAQELRLLGEAGAIQWLAGGFYSRDSVLVNHFYSWMADPACGVECDFGIGGGGIGLVFGNSFRQKRESYAVYARGEYDVTPDLTLAFGGRYSRDEISIKGLSAFFGDSGTQFPTLDDVSRSRAFDRFTGEASLGWDAVEDTMVYASFKQGYRSGAFNALAFVPAEVTNVPPEVANSFELGHKTELLDRRVTLNSAAFYTRYKNQQVISSEGGLFPLRNVSKSRIYGIETDLTVRPASALTLNLSVGYLSPKYREGIVANIDVAGNQIANAAKWTVHTGADWRIAELESGTINLHVDAKRQSRVYFDVHNSEALSDSGHIVANAQLSFNTESWDFELWATNFTNTHYATYAVNTQIYGFNYINRGVPRQFGARIRAKF